ncbi:MAG: hypothetical protein ACLRX4_02075 [Oscillospiraceae bacterium]
MAYRDDASHLENGLQTLKRQAWLKNARGFEGGIYYVPSGAEGHFDVCRAGETVGAVSVDKCENGLATIGEFWLENDVQGLGFGQQLVGQALSTPARTGASGFRPDALPRATRSACAARRNGALRRPARGRTGSNFRRILNTMRNPAGKNCRK